MQQTDARRKLFSRFKTQAEVDQEIDRLISLAVASGERRDRQEYESPEYWKHHDICIRYHQRAEALMPAGRRFF